MSAQEAEVIQPEQEEDRSIAKREGYALAQRVPDIHDLMSQAIATGDMNTIERVFALHQEIEAKAARSAFFNALSLFQSICPKIPKTKKGYDYMYAPLGVIESKIQKPMETAGLSKRWRQSEDGDTVTIACVVSHSGGHSEEASIGPVGWDLLERTNRMNGLQHRGAVITYLQRYTLIAALGIATADDDPDGVIPAEARESRGTVKQPSQKPTAQRGNGPKEKVQLEPASSPEERADAATIAGLRKAMEHVTLGNREFTERFPLLSGLEQLKRTDARIVSNWINNPQKN